MKRKVLLVLIVLLCFSNSYGQLLHKVASLDVYDDHIQNIFASDSLLFVIRADWDNENGFSVNIYNISDPAKPYLIGRQHKETYEGESKFQGRVIFIQDSGFQYPFYVILSEDKTKAIHFFWYPNKVIESNEYFYEFRSFDSNVRIHQTLSATTFQQVKSYPLSVSKPIFTGLSLIDDVIYIITKNAGLILLDVADIDSINELTSPITGCNLVRIMSGNHKVWLEKDTGEIIELDASRPRHPIVSRIISDIGYNLTGFWQDSKFYLKGENEVAILDSDFNVENTLDFPEYKFIDSFTKTNQILIVSSTTGVKIYRFTDESISSLSKVRKSIGEAIHFEKRDNLLFVADFADGLTIVDITKVQQPKLLSKYYLNGNTRDIKVSGNYAYLADYVHGLVVMQISEPEHPQLISTLHFDGGAMSLDIREKTIFLTTNKNELFAIDINEPKSPKILHRMYFDGYYYSEEWLSEKNVLVAGDYVWVCFDNSPLFAYCYSRNNGFIEKARFDEPFPSWGNEIKAFDYLLFFSQDNGIQIIDINHLSYIHKERFAAGLEWNPEAVALRGDTLFVSMIKYGVSGIDAYDISDTAKPIKLPEHVNLFFAPPEMIFENNYLFILTPTGIRIYSPESVTEVNENNCSDIIGFAKFQLIKNFPNPFNTNTTISMVLPEQCTIVLDIYDLAGRRVRRLDKGVKNAGTYKLVWNGKNDNNMLVASSVYISKLTVLTKKGLFSQIQKLVLIR